MPSTRRSQVSGIDQDQGQREPSSSSSPKITRAGRVLPPQDAVEQESAARSAKKRKIESTLPFKAIVDQNVDQSASDDQAQADLKSVKRGTSRDEGINSWQDDAQVLEEDKDEQDTSGICPAVPSESEAGLKRSPTTVSVPVDAFTLDGLADQILNINVQTAPKELGSAIKDPASDIGKMYVQLQAQFAAAKEKYSGGKAFISPSALGPSTPICRRVNVATFVSSLFDGKVSLEDLDNYFLFTFLPRGGTLSKLAASLWVELKTQAFIISVVTCDPRPPAAVLSLLFSESVRQRLLDVRPGAEELAPSEEDFMSDMKSRRGALEAALTRNDSQALPRNYQWTELLENAVSYIKILKLDDDKLTGSERLLLKPRQDASPGGEAKRSSQSSASNGTAPSCSVKATGYLDTPQESFKYRLARCALLAIGGPFTHDGNLPYPLIRYSTQLQEELPAVADQLMDSTAENSSDVTGMTEASIPHSSQTAPTLVLYERARKAFEIEALHLPQPANSEDRKAERRKWTLEEEHALLKGLDRVRGPHWSQLLLDQQLQDRMESELKDKARSLKIFFLKAGIEVPFYLKDTSKSGSTVMPRKQEEEKPSAPDAA